MSAPTAAPSTLSPDPAASAAPTAPTPPGPRGAGSRALLWIGGTLGVLAMAQIAYQGLDWFATSTTTSTAVYAAAPVVELTTDGDVTVSTGDAGTVTVVERTRTGFQRTSHDTVESADRLAVEHACPTWWSNGTCRIDLAVEVPQGTDVVVRSSSGEVRAEGVDGHVDLRTEDGDVTVLRAGGAVDAESSSGHVRVEDAGGEVVARSSDGDVTVRDVAGGVSARSASGHVVVSEAEGDVSAASLDGDVEARAVEGGVVATSSAGAVEVGGVTGDVEASSLDGDVTVRGTGTPVALAISTGDGRSTVEAPTDPGAPRTVVIRSASGDVSYLDAR